MTYEYTMSSTLEECLAVTMLLNLAEPMTPTALAKQAWAFILSEI